MIKKIFDCPLCFDKNSHQIPIDAISGRIMIYYNKDPQNNLFLDILNVEGSVCYNKLREIEGSNVIAERYLTSKLHLAIAKIDDNSYRLFFTENQATKISITYKLDELREIIDRIKEILFKTHSKIAEESKNLNTLTSRVKYNNSQINLAWLVNEEVQEIINPFYKAINRQRKGII